MKKGVALILSLLVGGGLMIYSASRTVNLLQMTLPSGQKELAFLALLAFDGGLVAWTLTFMFGAEGGYQRALSLLLTIVSLVGVVVGFGADQLLGAQSGGVLSASDVPQGFGLTVVMATVAIIALHIAGVTFFHLLSPENRRRMQEESFKDRIEEAAFKKSGESVDHIAAQLANEMTESRMGRLMAVYQNQIVRDNARTVKELEPKERQNGHKSELVSLNAASVDGPMVLEADVSAPKVTNGKRGARG
jgi:hypothetical protein